MKFTLTEMGDAIRSAIVEAAKISNTQLADDIIEKLARKELDKAISHNDNAAVEFWGVPLA